MKKIRLLLTLAVLFLFLFLPRQSLAEAVSVLEVEISGAISPASEELLQDALAECRDKGHDLLLVRLDTPGGLGESMRNMVKLMLNAPVPVAVWVGPPGARAASAGVFLVAASAVAGMAPQTTIGAASPVGLGGEEINKTMASKVVNDMESLVRGVAESHGRNAAWYSDAVRHSVSITDSEALEKNVVEFVARSVNEFLVKAGEKGILFKGNTLTFSEADLSMTRFVPTFRHEFLSWLLHPQIAYLLLLGGMMGLFIELTHPGTVFPGVFGGLCLLLALFALSVLPTNITGLLLILFGLVLFILEIKITSYGMLSVAAVVSLFLGSVILFRDEYGTISIPISFIVWPVALISLVMILLVTLVVRAQRRPSPMRDDVVGLVGEVRQWEGNSGQIFVRGEIWAAKGALSDFPLSRGSKVKIIARNGLKLEIVPKAQEPLQDKG
ncbi:NfeD family protein [Pseudodesulfovibrio tunisiensis]|uniref:NfeD family protein n=1 Tax=Pseudodesulfovibrio tunisiensis TaxID=463192 RepID=UPI001FB1C5FA|nr:NfeD family protein [Pseudodesulfovibrio tunisiensis]